MSAWLANGYRSGLYVKTGAVIVALLVVFAVFSSRSSESSPWPTSTSWSPKGPWSGSGTTTSAANPVTTGTTEASSTHETSSIGINTSIASHDLLDDVANATLGFQGIFAITMPYRVDQRDALSLAGAVTGINVTLVDGVSSLDAKTLPPGPEEYDTSKGWIKAWRAHLDTLRMVVRENLTSALIFEGDVDWDLRVKAQLRDFARASQVLTQPRRGTKDDFLDPTHPKSRPGETYHDFDLSEEDLVERPVISPYGDNWDVLWLGHCGVNFPRGDDDVATPPLGRVPIPNDQTVPAHEDLDLQYGSDEIKDEYPQYTRVVQRARENVCSLAYAVTQTGARRILYELSIRRIDAAFDIMLREYCDGIDGRRLRTCVSVQPTYFAQHRRAGSNKALSDIGGADSEGNNEVAFTRNVRWSVQTNMQRILDGETELIDWHRGGRG